MIWRPIMAGHLTLTEARNGPATLDDCLKINAILDAQEAAAEREREKK